MNHVWFPTPDEVIEESDKVRLLYGMLCDVISVGNLPIGFTVGNQNRYLGGQFARIRVGRLPGEINLGPALQDEPQALPEMGS